MQPIVDIAPHHAPEFPAGQHELPPAPDAHRIALDLAALSAQPARLRAALRGLNHEQLETRYRNWTVRQITHHVADSTLNMFVRWKLALTEERPTVKPFDETEWAKLEDNLSGDVELSLTLFESLVGRWVYLAKSMRTEDFNRIYFHPQYNREFALWQILSTYAWHGDHHMSQIEWLRVHYHWGR